jgi:hypothetical protein
MRRLIFIFWFLASAGAIGTCFANAAEKIMYKNIKAKTCAEMKYQNMPLQNNNISRLSGKEIEILLSGREIITDRILEKEHPEFMEWFQQNGDWGASYMMRALMQKTGTWHVKNDLLYVNVDGESETYREVWKDTKTGSILINDLRELPTKKMAIMSIAKIRSIKKEL